MTDALSNLSSRELKIGLIYHPVSGWMTVAQGLKFVAAHMQHHCYQLGRLKKCVHERAEVPPEQQNPKQRRIARLTAKLRS